MLIQTHFAERFNGDATHGTDGCDKRAACVALELLDEFLRLVKLLNRRTAAGTRRTFHFRSLGNFDFDFLFSWRSFNLRWRLVRFASEYAKHALDAIAQMPTVNPFDRCLFRHCFVLQFVLCFRQRAVRPLSILL